MSLSEIIKTKYKSKIKTNKLNNKQQVANYIITDPEVANKGENYEGSEHEQVQIN